MTKSIAILYEDRDLLVIDKPAGWLVHEGAGHEESNQERTAPLITDWLKSEKPEIVDAFAHEKDSLYFRPGIVHRLDKLTSGLLVIAKRPEVRTALQAEFKSRSVTKIYQCLVLGEPIPATGSIETLIGRNPRHRREMTVILPGGNGKEAKTDYETKNRWSWQIKNGAVDVTLLEVTLHSGRMHQIRVHCKYMGWPILGDQTYQTKGSRNISKELGLERQFLHATHLQFSQPITGSIIAVTSELPEDLSRTLEIIKRKGETPQ